jgi:hypothetical protein
VREEKKREIAIVVLLCDGENPRHFFRSPFWQRSRLKINLLHDYPALFRLDLIGKNTNLFTSTLRRQECLTGTEKKNNFVFFLSTGNSAETGLEKPKKENGFI